MVGVGSTETGDEPLYLRGRDENGAPQPVWGAIVDTYRNQTTGQVLSCAKFLYLMPGDGRGDVRRQYVVSGKPVDPRRIRQYRDAPFTPAQLKATYPDCLTFPSCRSVSTHIWSAMGLSEAACRLLHKIQSTDTPSGYDDIFKQGVLGVPEALDLARTTVEDYEHFDENFHAMDEKTRHMDTLRGIQQAYGEYAAARRARPAPSNRSSRPSTVRYGPCCETGHWAACAAKSPSNSRRPRRTTEQRGGSQAAAPPNRRPAHPSRHDPRPDAGSGRRQPDPTRTRTRPGPPHPRRRASQPNTNRTNVRIHRRDAARRRTGLERTPHQRRELQTRIQQTVRRMRGSPHRRHQRAGRRTRRPRTTATRLRPATLPAHPHLPADGRNPRHALSRYRTHPRPNCRTWPNSWT